MSTLAGRIVGVDRLTREECLNVVRKQPQLEFVPGSRYTYNSTAWVILAEILKKVTGESADDWVTNNILKPLQMNDTQIESYVGEVIHNAAESYSYNNAQGYRNEESNRAIFGAAEIYTSIHDLVKWVNNYRTAKIGGKAVTDLFFDPFILNDGTNSEYALGIGTRSYRGLKQYSHNGGHEAFISDLNYFPDEDIAIITISNFGGRGRLSPTKIADLLLEEKIVSQEIKEHPKVEIEKSKLEQFAGLYIRSTLNAAINLSIVKGILTINGRVKLIPASQNTFWLNGGNDLVKIEHTSKGEIRFMGVRGRTFTKVDQWNPNENELTSFEGDYWSDELETVYHLNIKNKRLVMNHRWLGNITLQPVAQDFFRTNWGYFVKFTRDKKNKVSGLSINSNRTLNVLFHRKDN